MQGLGHGKLSASPDPDLDGVEMVFGKDAEQRLQGPLGQVLEPLKDRPVCFLLLRAAHEDRR
jgi:hypothetical protein